MKYDESVYTSDGCLLFEPLGDEVLAVAEATRATASGCVRESTSTSLSLPEAIKARRALTRTIRSLRARQEEQASP